MRRTLAALLAVGCLGPVTAAASASPFIQAKLTAAGGDASGSEGISLAVSADGSTIAAGAPGVSSLQGQVYVYEQGAAPWKDKFAPAKLSAPGGAAGDQFGSSVAVSADGSVIVAGAPDAAGAGQQQGALFVFTRGPNGWRSGVQVASLTESNPADYDRLGQSVAVSGDGALIAAGTPSSGNFKGAVLLFSRPAGGWVDGTHQFTTLGVTGGAAQDQLGKSVAVSGDGSVVAAGAPGVNSSAGAAYVFQNQILHGWTEVGALTASAGTSGDQLGTSVDTSGAAVVAGAPHWSSSHGAAYVFLKPASHNPFGYWHSTTESARLTAPAGAAGDALGSSVALSGDGGLIAAGTPTTTSVSTPATGPGSIYLFTRSGTTFGNGPQLTAGDGQTGDAFGWSVAMSSQGVIVGGAPKAVGGQGVAYAFTGSSETAVDCQPSFVTVGAPATCTATVTDSGSGSVVPTGDVFFTSDSAGAFSGSSLGTLHEAPHCNLVAAGTAGTASCAITYTPSAAGGGTHTITGSYPGDSGHGSSQGSTQLGVTLAPTTASVRCTPRSIAVGHPTSCAATIAAAPAGGVVRFLTDSRGSFSPHSTCTLKQGGSCAVSYTPAAVGRFATHEISVRYAGDGAHASSFGTTQLAVMRAQTATTVRCRPADGQRVKARRFTCTATVAETRSGTATPTGEVSLTGGSCRLRATRRAGVASCRVVLTVNTPGRHRISATYGGDRDHFGSTGSTLVRARRKGGSR